MTCRTKFVIRCCEAIRGVSRGVEHGKKKSQQAAAACGCRRGDGRLPFFGLVATAAGHVDSPTVTALHAFIGDPLFGLDTADGELFGIDEDDQTAMASTTKIWALDVTVHALDSGGVTLDDEVTINAFEAGVGRQLDAGRQHGPARGRRGGEARDLIRGMMYPSGNNATYAIARHVAQYDDLGRRRLA